MLWWARVLMSVCACLDVTWRGLWPDVFPRCESLWKPWWGRGASPVSCMWRCAFMV